MLNLLATKAELVFAVQVATRHRAPRLAAMLGLGLAALAAASQPPPDRIARVVLLVAGMLAAVCSSRLLAPGPALAAGRMVVAPWWLVPVGRLTGAFCVLGPLTVALALALASASPHATSVFAPTGVALVYAVCVGACTMATAPFWGASAAASLGFLGVWVGTAPPSAMAAVFAGWVPLQGVVIWLWNVLPLPWRASRWLEAGGLGDPLVLATWSLIGLGVASLHLVGTHRPRRAEP